MEEKKRESYVEGRAWWRMREGKEKEREEAASDAYVSRRRHGLQRP